MRKIRIMVVDDVAIVRRLVTDALSIDPELMVVGTAANGREALERIPALRPDLLVLDYEMPEMDGLETLVEVRKSHPSIRVIIFSSYSRHGAKVTLDALWSGADDYVTKTHATNLAAATELVRTQLIPKIKALCAPRAAAEDRPAPATEAVEERPMPGIAATIPPVQPEARPAPRPAGPAPRVELVAIGTSTGGPKALARVLEGLPSDFSIPVVIVQHMPPLFTKFLAERLATRTALPCAEGVAGTKLGAGAIWIAPGDQHLILEREGTAVRIRLTGDPPIHSCRPAVDPFFRSAAEVYGSGVLGVILTGMGQDGLKGCELVRDAGGQILAQNEASSVVWGMPGAVARAGLADKVLPLEELAGEIMHRVTIGSRRRAPVG